MFMSQCSHRRSWAAHKLQRMRHIGRSFPLPHCLLGRWESNLCPPSIKLFIWYFCPYFSDWIFPLLYHFFPWLILFLCCLIEHIFVYLSTYFVLTLFLEQGKVFKKSILCPAREKAFALKQRLVFFQKITRKLTSSNPAIPLLHTFPGEMKTCNHIRTT